MRKTNSNDNTSSHLLLTFFIYALIDSAVVFFFAILFLKEIAFDPLRMGVSETEKKKEKI